MTDAIREVVEAGRNPSSWRRSGFLKSGLRCRADIGSVKSETGNAVLPAVATFTRE